jgi:hypothetical protein
MYYVKFVRYNLKASYRRHVCKVSYLLIFSQAYHCNSQQRPQKESWWTHVLPVTAPVPQFMKLY